MRTAAHSLHFRIKADCHIHNFSRIKASLRCIDKIRTQGHGLGLVGLIAFAHRHLKAASDQVFHLRQPHPASANQANCRGCLHRTLASVIFDRLTVHKNRKARSK